MQTLFEHVQGLAVGQHCSFHVRHQDWNANFVFEVCSLAGVLTDLCGIA